MDELVVVESDKIENILSGGDSLVVSGDHNPLVIQDSDGEEGHVLIVSDRKLRRLVEVGSLSGVC